MCMRTTWSTCGVRFSLEALSIFHHGNIIFAAPSLIAIPTPPPNLGHRCWWNWDIWKPHITPKGFPSVYASSRRKWSNRRPYAAGPATTSTCSTRDYQYVVRVTPILRVRVRVLHPGAPWIINFVRKCFATLCSTPIPTPLPNLVNISWWKLKIFCSHSKKAPITSSPKTRRNTIISPVFYTLVRLE